MWAYWISPLTYAQNALAVNEFKAHRWNVPNTSNSTGVTLGDAVLLQRGLHTNVNWVWIGVGTLLGFAVIFNGLLVLAFDNIPGEGLVLEMSLDGCLKYKKRTSPCMYDR